MTTTKKIGLGFALVVLGFAGFVYAHRPTLGPCAEPELPVAQRRVIACAEHYVRSQWYTSRWGHLGPVDADPHGHGSWTELVSKHRGTLPEEMTALCTHPQDRAGALGATALFEPVAPGAECRAFAITPLLGVSLKEQSCAAVRAQSACVDRNEALRAR